MFPLIGNVGSPLAGNYGKCRLISMSIKKSGKAKAVYDEQSERCRHCAHLSLPCDLSTLTPMIEYCLQ